MTTTNQTNATAYADLCTPRASEDTSPQAASSVSPDDREPPVLGEHGSGDVDSGEGDTQMGREEHCRRLAAALAGCGDLEEPSPEQEELWLALYEAVRTRTRCHVVPLGATAPVEVTDEYGGLEVLEAWGWLRGHEREARSLSSTLLFRRCRAAATRGAHGSARMAQQDSLHGMTGVGPGQPLGFVSCESAAFREWERS